MGQVQIKKMKVAVIIPTKNRPDDLSKCLLSIRKQTLLPSQLIIVDQSLMPYSYDNLNLIFDKKCKVHVDYVHDQSIAGLVSAKIFGVKRASSELIFFLEDDVELQEDYIENLVCGFVKNPSMVGSSGIITNYPNKTYVEDLIFSVFHIGIFNDIRFKIYKNYLNCTNTLVFSNKLSGGISAWKSYIFKYVPFDDLNKFHFYEDIEFSTRVNERFPGALYINTEARLKHNYAPSNRQNNFDSEKNKIRESIMYFRKRKRGMSSRVDILVLLFGLFLKNLIVMMTVGSTSPMKAYCRGIKAGFFSKLMCGKIN